MQFAVSTYSFAAAVRSGAIDYLQIPSLVKEMGFDALEVASAGLAEGASEIEVARKLRAACDALSLPIVNYTTGADFIRQDADAEIERVKTKLEIARTLGVTGMRHDAAGGANPEIGVRTFDDALPILARACRSVTEYAAGLGIRTMVENHGRFAQDSRRVEELVSAVGHPNFGLLVDIGNFLCVDENPAVAVGRVAPLAFHVHAKDFFVRSGQRPQPGQGWFATRGGNYLRGTIVGHGEVPVDQCLRILRQAGYDGVVSIEFEGIEEPLSAIRQSLDNLKRLAAVD